MAIPIIYNWIQYFANPDEGLGSSYERIILNRKLEEICSRYDISNILEAPVFGFTGISGINSLGLAGKKHEITLVDHDQNRIELIKQTWQKLNRDMRIFFVQDYNALPFSDNEFDLSWNFSALWFTGNLNAFLSELTRVTRKALLICVPNRSGLGYLSQKLGNSNRIDQEVKEDNIVPKSFVQKLLKLGWSLQESDYIDCPPWPDIGMPKEKFLEKIGLGWLSKQSATNHQPISIMDYYTGRDESFPERMMKHYWLERKLPGFLKRFWAHHRFFLFLPEKAGKAGS